MLICNRRKSFFEKVDQVKGQSNNPGLKFNFSSSISQEGLNVLEQDYDISGEELNELVEYIQHENLIGRRLLSERLWDSNGGYALTKNFDGKDSLLFDQLSKKYDEETAYNIKKELFRQKFIMEFGDWLAPNMTETLQNQNRVNEIGEPIIFIDEVTGLPSYYSKELDGDQYVIKHIEGFSGINVEEIVDNEIFNIDDTGRLLNQPSTEEEKISDSIIYVIPEDMIDALDINAMKSWLTSRLLSGYGKDLAKDGFTQIDVLKTAIKIYHDDTLKKIEEESVKETPNEERIQELKRDQKYFNYLYNNFDFMLNEVKTSNSRYFKVTFEKYDNDSSEDIEGDRGFGWNYDEDQLTIDPLMRSGIATKRVFDGIKINPGDDYYFSPTHDPRKLQNEILYLLSRVEPDFDSIIQALEDYYNTNKAANIDLDYIPEIINRLNNLSPELQRMFVQDMHNAYHDLVAVYYEGDKLEVRDVNNANLDLINNWTSQFLSKSFVRMSGDKAIIDIESIDRLKKAYDGWREKSKELIKELTRNTALYDRATTAESKDVLGEERNELIDELIDLYDSVFQGLGIVLSTEHLRKLADPNQRYFFDRNIKSKSEIFSPEVHLFDSNKAIGQIYRTLFDNADLVAEAKTDINSINVNFKTIINNYVYNFARNELVYSKVIPNSGTIINGKMMFPYSMQFLWNETFFKLQQDTEIDKLRHQESYYTRGLDWLNETKIIGDKEFRTVPKVKRLRLVSFSPDILGSIGRNSNQKLNELSNKDAAIVELGMFVNRAGKWGVVDGEFIHRPITGFYTPSDSSKFFGIEHEAPRLRDIFSKAAFTRTEFRNVGNGMEYLDVDQGMINKLYQNLFSGELNRIFKYYNGENVSDNLKYNEAGGYFIQFPELNDLKVNGYTDTDGNPRSIIDILRGSRNDVGEQTLTNQDKVNIEEAIKDWLKKYIIVRRTKLLKKWNDTGIISKEGSEFNFSIMDANFFNEFKNELARINNGKYDNYFPRDIRNFATYFVITNALAEANIVGLFLGDPVQFSVFKNNRPNIENGIETSFNVLKRSRMFNTTKQPADQSEHRKKGLGYIVFDEPSELTDDDSFYKWIGLQSVYNKDIKVNDAGEFITVPTALYYAYQNADITYEKYQEELAYYEEHKELKDKRLRLGFSKRVLTGRVWDRQLHTYINQYVKSGTTVLHRDALPKEWHGVIDRLEDLEKNNSKLPDHLHLVSPTSVKVGMPAYNLQPLFDEEGKVNEQLFEDVRNGAYMPSDPGSMGLQIREPNKDELPGQATIKLSTQFRQFIMLNMLEFDNAFKLGDEVLSGKELFDRYVDVVRKLYKNKANNFLRKHGLSFDSDEVISKEVFYAKIKQTLKNAFAKSDEADIAEILLKYNEETQEFTENIGLSLNKRIESNLMSLLKKHFNDHKFPGNSLYVTPHYNLKYNPKDKDLKIVWVEEKEVQELRGPSDQVLDEEGKVIRERKTSVDVLIPSKLTDNKGNLIDLFEKDSNGNYIWIRESENGYILSESIPREIFNTVAYRTPTGSMSYMLDINVVGFLPESMGNQVITLKDVIPKTGHDNDGDKLSIFIMNHKVIDVGGMKQIIVDESTHTGTIDDVFGMEGNEGDGDIVDGVETDVHQFNYGLQNEMIRIYKSILSSQNKDVQRIIYTPVEADRLSKQADALRDIKNFRLSQSRGGRPVYFNIFDGEYQNQLRINNADTNKGTGFYASVANFVSQVYFTERLIEDNKVLISEDDSIEDIFKWYLNADTKRAVDFKIAGIKASEKITASPQSDILTIAYNQLMLSNAVDNGKNLLMKDLNDNTETFNARLAMLMLGLFSSQSIETGIGKLQMDPINLLLNQPAVIEFINKKRNKKSRIRSGNTSSLGIIKEMFGEDVIKDARASKEDPNLTNYDIRDPKAAQIKLDWAIRILKTQSSQNLFNNIRSGKNNPETGLAAIIMFNALDKIGNQMSSINQLIGYDRNGIGTSYYDGVNMEASVSKLRKFPNLEYAELLLFTDAREEINPLDALDNANYFPGIGYSYLTVAYNKIINNLIKPIYVYHLYGDAFKEYLNWSKRHRNLDEGSQVLAPVEDLGPDVISFVKSYIPVFKGEDLSQDTPGKASKLKVFQKKLMFDRGVKNKSLASVLFEIQQLYPDNAFLNVLDVNLKSFPEHSTITLNPTKLDARSRAEVIEGINDLLMMEDPFVKSRVQIDGKEELTHFTFFNKYIDGKYLLELLHLYSELGNHVKWGTYFDLYIPYEIRTNVSDTRASVEALSDNDYVSESILKRFEAAQKFAIQRLQHYPEQAAAYYKSYVDLVSDGYIMFDTKGNRTTAIANADVIVKKFSDEELEEISGKSSEEESRDLLSAAFYNDITLSMFKVYEKRLDKSRPVPAKSVSTYLKTIKGQKNRALFIYYQGNLKRIPVLGTKNMTEYDPFSKELWAESVFSINDKQIQYDRLVAPQVFYKYKYRKLKSKLNFTNVYDGLGYSTIRSLYRNLGKEDPFVVEMLKDNPDMDRLYEFIKQDRYREYRDTLISAVLAHWEASLHKAIVKYNAVTEKRIDNKDFLGDETIENPKQFLLELQELEELKNDVVGLINNINEYFNTDVLHHMDEMYNFSDLMTMKRVLETFYSIKNPQDIVTFIDNNIQRNTDMGNLYRKRWGVIKKHVGNLKGVNYKYVHEPGDRYAGEYDKKNKEVTVSLLTSAGFALAEYNQRNPEKFMKELMVFTLIHELEHFYYREVIEDYVKQSYDIEVRGPMEIYTKKKGAKPDPNLDILIDLMNFYQDKLGMNKMSEKELEDIYQGKKGFEFSRSLNLTEMIATSYTMTNVLDDASAMDVNLSRFPALESYIKKNEGATSLQIINDVMERLSSFEKIGVDKKGNIKEGFNNPDKINC